LDIWWLLSPCGRFGIQMRRNSRSDLAHTDRECLYRQAALPDIQG
jgi:hypothetical protein